MMLVVTGGSGSGKSAYAEARVEELAGKKEKYYIATMQVYDREAEEKVNRHRQMRAGKGFITIEQPVRIGEACRRMRTGERAALLECMSNLAANEMFSSDPPGSPENTAERILQGIRTLKQEADPLVIVTNNVFEDGCLYDRETEEYIRALGLINCRLAAMADSVVEVVAGIPVVLKEGRAK